VTRDGSVYGRRLGRVNRRVPSKAAFGPWCCHTTQRSFGCCGEGRFSANL
jgi:hypothetical protein